MPVAPPHSGGAGVSPRGASQAANNAAQTSITAQRTGVVAGFGSGTNVRAGRGRFNMVSRILIACAG